MKPIPLFGSGIDSISKIVTAQRRLNCFWDLRPDGDKNDAVLIGTPGLLLWISLNTYPIRGWRVVGSLLYVVSGNALYSVTTGGIVSSLGTITTYTGYVTLSDNFVQLIIMDGTAGYIFTIATLALTTIVDANFPVGATTVAFLDGRFVVEKASTRQFFVSASYDGTNWTPVAFATKENYSDLLVAVDVFNGSIILWGVSSTEFWWDAGLAVMPYARIQGSTQSIGLQAKWSRAPVGNMMYFLGKTQQGAIKVYRLNGYNPEPISNSDIEAAIEDIVVTTDAVALSYTIYGHAMYQLTFPSGGRSFLFDSLTNMWQEVQSGLALIDRHSAELGISFNSVSYVSDKANGNIYLVDDLTYTDNGSGIRRQLTSKHIRNGGNSFGIDELYLDMETGVGLQAGQGSDPQVSVETSKDGGRTFGIPSFKPLGMVGQYRSPRVKWNRRGMARDFVFRFTLTDPVKFIVTGGAAVVRAGSEQ